MPVNWDDPQTWQKAYNFVGRRPLKEDVLYQQGAGVNQQLTYLDGRLFALQLADFGDGPGLSYARSVMNKAASGAPWTPSTDALIVGCGFGWMIESILAAGGNNVWGSDTSFLIHDAIANNPALGVLPEVSSRILNIDVTDPDAADQFKAVGAGNQNGKFRWIITEFVVESFNPSTETALFNTFLDSLESLRAPGQGGILHILAGRLPPPYDVAHDTSFGMTWLTLPEWALVRPSHLWLDIHLPIQTGFNPLGGQ